MEDVVIISATRTAIGKYGKTLAGIKATQLGAHVVGEALKRANLEPTDIDECIMGNVIQAGMGQNPARQAAICIFLRAWESLLSIYERYRN